MREARPNQTGGKQARPSGKPKQPTGKQSAKQTGQPSATQPAKQSHKKRRMSAGERNGAKKLLVILSAAALLYLLTVLIIALFIGYSFSSPAENKTLYALRLYEEDEKKPFLSYSVEQSNNRYGLYLRYSDLAERCGFGVAGDGDQVTLFLPGGASAGSIVLYRNSSSIQVNGTTVRLSAPILFEGEDYLLPVSLFESYLHGLNIEYDADKLYCNIRIPSSPTFTLKLHKPQEAPDVDLSTLPSLPDTSDVSDLSGAASDTSGG